MIVVSDTSPLANLILIGKLELLEQLFGEILVPTAVHHEVMKLKPLGHDISSYEKAAWIKIRDAAKIKPRLMSSCSILTMENRRPLHSHWKYIVI